MLRKGENEETKRGEDVEVRNQKIITGKREEERAVFRRKVKKKIREDKRSERRDGERRGGRSGEPKDHDWKKVGRESCVQKGQEKKTEDKKI